MNGTDNQVLAGVNTYTGPTLINAGTLTVNGSLAAGSTLTVGAGGTLAGSGTIYGAANLSSGGAIAPGGNGTIGKLTFAGVLNLNGGGILNFDLAGTSPSDSLALTGAYVAPASGTVTINLSALTGLANGTYPLITGASGISAASFALGHAYQLSASGTTLSVIITDGISAPTGLAAVAANAEADLAWNASTGATSYTVLRGTVSGGPYATISSGLTSTSYSDMGLTNGITYYYVVTATSSKGASGNSNEAAATPNTTTVDSYWSDNDIGGVGVAGNSSYSSGTFTLNGSGTGVSGMADSLDFTYQTLVGDGAIVAKVATQSAGASGVMMRESLATNARVVDMMIQAGLGAVFQNRVTTGGSAVNGAVTTSIAVPYWVKLARVGNVFTGFISPDGVAWKQVGTVTDAMAPSISVGLAQSSLSSSSLASATFTSASIVPTSAWASVLVAALGDTGLNAQSSASTNLFIIPKMPLGDGLKSGEILSKCSDIFVGTITDLGLPTVERPDRIAYYNVKVMPSHVLRGTLSHTISVTLYFIWGSQIQEVAPVTGESYLFFLTKSSPETIDPFTALQLLPATKANYKEVQDLMADSPVPK